MYLTLSFLLSPYYSPPYSFSFCAPLLYEFPGRKTPRKAYVDADLIGRSRSLFFSFPVRKKERKIYSILEPRKLAVIEQTNTTIIVSFLVQTYAYTFQPNPPPPPMP